MSSFFYIDVSKYQGTIDWNKVKAAGVQGVFIRLGWAGYDGRIATNGGLDSKFYENMKGALALGFPVGVYVYSYVKTPQGAAIAAKEALELVKPYKLELPIVFDIEDNMYIAMTKSMNTAIAASFLNEIEKAKYYAMLYTYTYFAKDNLEMQNLSKYDLWIADYRAKLGYQGSYGIWQYSCTGRVNGINTDVDLNHAYKEYPRIIKEAGLNGWGQTTQPPKEPDYDKEEIEALRIENSLLKDKNEMLEGLIEEINRMTSL